MTLTDEAKRKLVEGATIIVVPKAVREVPLEMSDLANGEEGYHSINTIEELNAEIGYWTPVDIKINGFDYTWFRYALDDDGIERVKVREDLIAKGLVDIRYGKKLRDIDFTKFAGNEYLVMSISEKRLFDEMVDKEINEMVEI